MLRAMQAAFGSDSSFWREHQYSCEFSDYFSYLHPLNAASPVSEFSSSSKQPSSSSESSTFHELLQRHGRNELDGIIEYVRKVIAPSFPEVAEARYAEWWAHCRPHESGHQFHFDSDNEVPIPILDVSFGLLFYIRNCLLLSTFFLMFFGVREKTGSVTPFAQLCCTSTAKLARYPPSSLPPPPLAIVSWIPILSCRWTNFSHNTKN
jgi:hypothetical protein